MARLILYLVVVAAAAAGLSWLADRPGSLVVTWGGYEAQTSVFRAVVILVTLIAAVLLVWSLLRQVLRGPFLAGQYFSARRQKRGLDALSSGMIAIGAGDRAMAARYALLARKALPNEPLTHLLRAQAAQLSGDRVTARRIFEAMLATPDTEQLGLRGLFVEAQREGEQEAARQFAERALRLNPKLGWPVEALFALQCRKADWAGALETLAAARKAHNVSRLDGERRRAVLLTAQAAKFESGDPDQALSLALEAHGLAPDLVPAGAIAGRLLASRGNTPRATRVVERTWLRSPHPDLALVHAYARVGDSPRDRLERVRQLAALTPNAAEGPIAVATAAIEARLFDDARCAIEPMLDGRLTRRVALLMARIEGEQHGDKGRVREWLARAVNAPRDPAWTADGVVSEEWAPVSPVTGALDAFQWRVPVEPMEKSGDEDLAGKIEEFVPLGAAPEEAPPVVATAGVLTPTEAEKARPRPVAARTKTPLGTQDGVERPRAIAGHVEPAGRDAAGAGAAASSPSGPPAEETPIAEARETELAPRPILPSPAGQKSAGGEGEILAAGVADLARKRGAGREVTAVAPPRIYVPPRAPDDPGPGPGDLDDDRLSPGIARTS